MAQIVKDRPSIGAAFGTGLGSGLNTLAEAKIKQMIEAPQRQAYANALMSILAPEQAQQQQPNLPETLGLQEAQQGVQGQQPLSQQANLARALQQGGLNEQQLFQLSQLQQQKQLRAADQAKQARKETHEEQKEINTRTQKYYDSVVAGGKSAKNNIKRLSKLENLHDVPPAELYRFLSKVEEGAPNPVYGAAAGSYAGGQIAGPYGAVAGGIAGALLGPLAGTVKAVLARRYKDTEEFEKLSNDFVRDAKGIFGGRITDADLTVFMQTIPTLNQTDEGRRKIMKNMKAFNDAALAEYDSLEEIIKENGGKRPNGLEFLVQQRAQDKIDKAAQEFSA
jgi:hypothetical protein